jgi:hypothetical protein
MHVKWIAYLPINSHAEIVAEVLRELFALKRFIFFVFNFLEFAVIEYFCLNHPDIQIFLLCA